MKKRREDKFQRVLLQSLPDILDKWMKPAIISKAEIYDNILLDQFWADLQENMQKWVQCHSLKTSAEALHLAEDFYGAKGDPPQESSETRASFPSHLGK